MMSALLATVLTVGLSAAPAVSLPSAATTPSVVRQRYPQGEMVALDADKGFSRAMIESGLLAELNRYRWAPRTADGRFNPAMVRQVWRGRDFAMAFDGGGRLRFAMFRYAVPVNPAADTAYGWSPTRLARRADWLRRLRPLLGLKPAVRDRYGNVFGWRGRAPGAQARLRYEPTSDSLWLVMRYL